jgi:hypothetical protein
MRPAFLAALTEQNPVRRKHTPEILSRIRRIGVGSSTTRQNEDAENRNTSVFTENR